MMLDNQNDKIGLCQKLLLRSMQCLICSISLPISYAHADSSKEFMQSLKSEMSQIFVPKSDENYNKADIDALSNYKLDTSKVQELPLIQGSDRTRPFKINRCMSLLAN